MWSDRPQLLHLGLFFAAYFLGCAFAEVLGIVPGTDIAIWPPGGLFIATLIVTPQRTWPWWTISGCLAEMLGQLVWFHSPLPAGLLMYAGNALGAMTGAYLVNRAAGRIVRLNSLQEVLLFVVLGAVVAPAVSATVGAAAIALFEVRSQTFLQAWPLWWIGDATGILIVGPLVLAALQTWRDAGPLSIARWVEASVLAIVFLSVAAFSLSGPLPFVYLIMPPLLWAAVRFEFRGAVIALTVLAFITIAFTIAGTGQFAGDAQSQREKLIMLQLFLAISALSALIVAAISRQHQQALITLGESERELSQLVNMVPIHIRRLTPDGEPTFFNKRLMDFFGLGDLAGLDRPGMSRLAATIQSLVHPDDAAGLLSTARRSFAAGEPFSTKYRMRRADGVYRWVDTRGEPLRNQSGSIIQWYVISLDVDDEVRAQEALHEREREFKLLIDMVPSHVWRLSAQGEPTFYNKRLRDFLGFDVTDVAQPGLTRLKAALSGVVHPEDVSATEQALGQSLATGVSFSTRHRARRADGVYRWLEVRAEPLRDDTGAILQWYGVNVDIDDQVRLYNELQEREAKIRQLFDSDVIGVVFWDLNGTLIDANDAFLRIVQHDREELKAGLDWFAMTPPDWQEVHAREEAAELAATGRMQPREKEYFRKDGSRVPILIGAACFEGQPTQGVAFILDLTERKQAEAALLDRERELSQLVDLVPVYIRRLTPEGEPVFFNKRLTDFLGVDLADIAVSGASRLSPVVESFVHPDEAGELLEAVRRSVATGEGYSMKYRLRGPEGVYRWVDTRAEPVRHQDGTIAQWYVVSLDVEDQMRAEEALLEQQRELRMAQERLTRASQAASLAELSASIAHEVNQPLAAVVANAHACQRWLASDPPNLERAQTTVERIIRDANAAADVVGRIRALFKQNVSARSGSSLVSVIADAKRWVSDLALRHGVILEERIEPGVPPVAIDQVQMQQVMINLMRNAVEAMAGSPGARTLSVRVSADGDVVRIEVRDTGRGLEDAKKIFDPFFTTKENGMGMGLAISRSIVESHGGRLWAEQNEDGGATLIFSLPVDSPARA